MIVGVLPKLQFMDLDGNWMVVPNPSTVQPKPLYGLWAFGVNGFKLREGPLQL